MENYIPKNWKVKHEENKVLIVGDRYIAEVDDWGFENETKTNAYLIASAPDLLEACKKALDWIKDGRTPSDCVCAKIFLQQAINKAEGNS